MPADFESGFFVREPAWHGEGYVADRHPASWDEAREWAGLLWEPEARPLYAHCDDLEVQIAEADRLAEGDSNEAEIAHLQTMVESFSELPDHRQIVRNDTGATLGVVSNYYNVISHAEMGEVVEAILEQTGVKYDTAGSLQGGRAVWALAYLDEPVVLPGDNSQTYPYLALTTRHDGTGALKALSTSVRIVCSNTLSAAEGQGEQSGTVFTFSHSSGWRDRIEEARETITGVRREFNEYVDMAEHLLNVRVTHEQTEQFITAFIPAPPEGLVTDRVMKNVEDARNSVRLILQGPTTETIAHTAFGLVSAAGEYLDHYRSFRSMDTHYARQLLRPEPLKAKAVRLVEEVVGA